MSEVEERLGYAFVTLSWWAVERTIWREAFPVLQPQECQDGRAYRVRDQMAEHHGPNIQ